MSIAGIILCGGRSSRMGLAKAALPFGDETLLARMLRLLSEVAHPIVVVAAPDQQLPALAGEVRVVRDRREGRGPLEGMLAGLAGLADETPAAYVTSCDVPLLVPGFVERMAELLGDRDVSVPYVEDRHHPLAAVYRPSVVPHIEALLAADRLRPIFLYERVKTRLVTSDELRDVDPTLATLSNLNRPEDYLAALKAAGFEPPAEVTRALAAHEQAQGGSR